jgi:BCD family chlorophyll transporter-like MFS transporter
VQATAAGVAVALGGVLRDAVDALAGQGHLGAALAHTGTGYAAVYSIEILLLLVTVRVMSQLPAMPLGSASPAQAQAPALTLTTP